MKALVVILNKNNAKNLRNCLNSLTEQTAKICKDFDLLILDGGSTDDSKAVAEEFIYEYGCIKFKIQDKLGGTGYARREACNYALENDYNIIIWGDSENVYAKDYIEKMIGSLGEFDAVSGTPKVCGGFFAHAFAWYHSIHLIFPGLYKFHLPGNNKGEKVSIFNEVVYPESKRAEDYGFSVHLLKKGKKLRTSVVDSNVYISVPEKLKEIGKWQMSRAKGVAEAAKIVGFKPIDSLAWSLIFFSLIVSLIISPINHIPLLLYSAFILIFSTFLFVRSLGYVKSPKKRYFLAPLIGVLIHSLYSILSLFYYFKSDENI